MGLLKVLFLLSLEHGVAIIQLHGSCASLDGDGVLLLGAPGAGKSGLLLRLLDRGFALVADDRVEIEDGVAWAPEALAGLLEVRGLGIVRMPYVRRTALRLAVQLERGERLPEPERFPDLHLPMVYVDPQTAQAPQVVALALGCLRGTVSLVAGALA